MPRPVETAEDVDAQVLSDAEEVLEWFPDRIDWEMFLDRLSDKHGERGDPPYWIPSYDSPAVNKIKRHVRALKSE